MRTNFRKSGFLIIVTLTVFLCACTLNVKSIRKPSETSETMPTDETSSASEPSETALPTKKPTVTPTPTRQPSPTTAPSPTRIPTPKPSPTPIPLEDYHMYVYVITNEISARDEDGKTVMIPEGQIIRVYSLDWIGGAEGIETADETDRFFLGDTEFFPDFSTNEYGTINISGFPVYELFRTVNEAKSVSKPEVVLKPWVQIHNAAQYSRVAMSIDWDQDGITDKISLGRDKYSWSWILRFQNGSNGSVAYRKIDIYSSGSYEETMEYFESNWGEQNFEYSEDPDAIVVWNVSTMFTANSILLYQNSSGENVIMVGDDLSTHLAGENIPVTGFIRYSPTELFSIEEVTGVFEYGNKRFYKDDHSRVFGKTWTTKREVQLNDDFSYEYISENEEYMTGHRKYTYSLKQLNIEIIEAGGNKSEVLPAGSIVIPKRTEYASDGSGYVYVTLFDGRSARIKFERDSADDSIRIDGKSQEDVFFCYYLLLLFGG